MMTPLMTDPYPVKRLNEYQFMHNHNDHPKPKLSSDANDCTPIHEMHKNENLKPPTIHVATTNAYVYEVTQESKPRPVSHRIPSTPTIQRTNIETRIVINNELQGDTGANTSATNRRDLLWNYTRLRQPIEITTYNKNDDPETCVAICQGKLRIIADDNTTMEWTTLFVPSATGTVLSPDKYVQDNRHHLFLFNHEGDINGNGAIRFQNHRRQTILQITMKRRRDGLWFTTNQILAPPTKKRSVHTITQLIHQIPNNVQINRMQMPHCNEIGTPLPPQIMTQQENRPTNKSLHDIELWHQRMGHPGSRTLWDTQKVVDGMPMMPKTPAIFACPFCDEAKTQKRHGGPRSSREEFLPNTAYHMDLGFFRTSKPKDKQNQPRTGSNNNDKDTMRSFDGYVGYLLIIDAASRYAWVFLLRNKQPPTDLIDKFLDKYGVMKPKTTQTTISTHPKNILRKSKAFRATCNKFGYNIKPNKYELTLDEYYNHIQHATVRTDNGGELAGSEDF